ncbi:hypothetical protein LKO27_03455 [Tessaracoccus sp. OS52]|uniref:hypothetical protein n=1 Tax=Tessaracoccus sp. OS52 TaxID=2886691 RepID=UPI001D11094B|nr:hypothetical protein [Tessaracoccus sp. OS52]MCC2592478.1 hypothetical protein [Tessaracoccus sp. OS52]
MSILNLIIGTLTTALTPAGRGDERGLSQSTENAILLAGAVLIASLIVAAITGYVQANLPG